MKKSIVAIAAVAALIGTAGPVAGARQTVSEFLENCGSADKDCLSVTYNVILAGKSGGYICVPSTVSLDDAAAKQLAWLKQEAQSNPRFAKEDLEEAQWAAAGELWSCGKRH
jgi:hypothetical protein